MKVVLTKDVKNMGRAGSVIDASDGHALNFLIPRKLAVLATPTALKQAESRIAQTEAANVASTEAMKDTLASLAGKTVTLTAPANEQGHLYTGITGEDIVKAVAEQLTLTIPADAIDLDKPLKETGEHAVEVSSVGEKCSFTLSITAA